MNSAKEQAAFFFCAFYSEDSQHSAACMCPKNVEYFKSFNTSYLTDSYIVFTLKMESVSKNTVFGLKMIVKSGLEKFILKSLHAGR